MQDATDDGDFLKFSYPLVKENNINILWQVPQIFIMTASEILLSITGYEFSYSQAPMSMKAVVQAAWLLAISCGDAIIVIVEPALPSNDVWAYIIYAIIMTVAITVFLFMAWKWYKYVSYIRDDDETKILQHEVDAKETEAVAQR